MILFMYLYNLIRINCSINLHCLSIIIMYNRERKPGTLDVHPTLNALVLNYEIDVQILGAKENVLYEENKVLN